MKKFILFYLLTSSAVLAQEVEIIKRDRLEKILISSTSKIHVINFWATWCAPCVKELPQFEKLNAQTDGTIKVTLINLDFADKIANVNSFIARKNLKSPVVLLDEIDYNSWIDTVDKTWNGAIPATLIINTKTGRRKFVERELAEGELEKLIREVQ